MATRHSALHFLQGVGAGLAVAVGVFYLFASGGDRWLWANLGYSVIPFTLLLMLYGRHLGMLKAELAQPAPRQVEVEHLAYFLDLWSTVFFAAGVLWTAIGMRAALLGALGGDALQQGASPAMLLSRLVDGGILLALSTTIVGSLGGYCMRLVKTWTVGRVLLDREIAREQRFFGVIEDKLGRIETILRAGVSETVSRPSKENNN